MTLTPPPYPWSNTPDPTLNDKPTMFIPGPPKPTCTVNCGHPCRFFCSGPCLYCPPDIGRGGGGSGDDDNDECETTKSSICNTYCVKSASCTTSCGSTVGCSPTGSDGSQTFTPAPAVTVSWEHWPSTTDDTSSDLAAESRLADAIDSKISSDYPGAAPTGPGSSQPSEAACVIRFVDGGEGQQEGMVWLNNLSVLGGSPVNTQIYQACQAANINVTDHPPSANSDQFTDSNGVQWTATL